jgi:serine/threonine-protein kinase HipA
MTTPVWTWLPGSSEPVLAAHIDVEAGGGRFVHEADYKKRQGARALDPMHLRLGRGAAAIKVQGEHALPGVIQDAMPDGYGRDRLQARQARELGPLELLALGPPDGVGAIEVCPDIETKLSWRPHTLHELIEQVQLLDEDAPSSRAIRRMNDDGGTSAGGERPKATIEDAGSLWLAKLQDRGDAPHLPAREFVVMQMAAELGIGVPPIRFVRHGNHEVFLIERFDRAGNPRRPQRHLYASARTVLDLDAGALPGDTRRSYLVLADRMRRWITDEQHCRQDLTELWRRMAYNALVGNKDDHPRNHGLLHSGQGWRLSPAFDITPLPSFAGLLALSVLPDGSQECSTHNLLSVCSHFGVELPDAVAWLGDAAHHVAGHWQQRLRDQGVPDGYVGRFQPAFVMAIELAEGQDQLATAAEQVQAQNRRGARRPRRV